MGSGNGKEGPIQTAAPSEMQGNRLPYPVDVDYNNRQQLNNDNRRPASPLNTSLHYNANRNAMQDNPAGNTNLNDSLDLFTENVHFQKSKFVDAFGRSDFVYSMNYAAPYNSAPTRDLPHNPFAYNGSNPVPGHPPSVPSVVNVESTNRLPTVYSHAVGNGIGDGQILGKGKKKDDRFAAPRNNVSNTSNSVSVHHNLPGGHPHNYITDPTNSFSLNHNNSNSLNGSGNPNNNNSGSVRVKFPGVAYHSAIVPMVNVENGNTNGTDNSNSSVMKPVFTSFGTGGNSNSNTTSHNITNASSGFYNGTGTNTTSTSTSNNYSNLYYYNTHRDGSDGSDSEGPRAYFDNGNSRSGSNHGVSGDSLCYKNSKGVSQASSAGMSGNGSRGDGLVDSYHNKLTFFYDKTLNPNAELNEGCQQDYSNRLERYRFPPAASLSKPLIEAYYQQIQRSQTDGDVANRKGSSDLLQEGYIRDVAILVMGEDEYRRRLEIEAANKPFLPGVCRGPSFNPDSSNATGCASVTTENYELFRARQGICHRRVERATVRIAPFFTEELLEGDV
ncbi:hypothetical protein AGDE_13011 [Angomonas deanei]|uniref:Uncharacterized protein n=1 Tax=Angomonas deanei TaxID=59799 RepID=A0A7G2CA01_9TRYP|nr:hypothetical protein AGDE_13011 [Angomonas deanei]CAD2216586.1 hypothetical protein, conserved [Angomonas deanei]|eukprot:EPY23160.1 hypothetical protein AGDE_13011 [Angomonas deanei]